MNKKQLDAPLVLEPTKDKSYLHRKEAAVISPVWQAVAVFFVVLPLSFWLMNKIHLHGFGYFEAFLLAWVIGGGYYIFRLVRWDKLIEKAEIITGLELDGNPNTGRSMVIRLQEDDGTESVAINTGLPEEYKGEFVVVARRALNGASTSQAEMQKTFRISRGHWNKIMTAYVELSVLQKKNPGVSNSEYVLCKPEGRSRAVLQAIVNQDYTMVDNVWSND